MGLPVFTVRVRRSVKWVRVGLAAALIAATGALPVAAGAANRFDELRQQDSRVAGVAYRLATADPSQCRARPVPQLGFVIHSLAQYALRDRPGVAANFNLSEGVAVEAVIAGSPADQAGLAANDRLLSVNGVALVAALDLAPTRDAVEDAQRILVGELTKGAATLRVAGVDGERTVPFDAARGCPSRVELVLTDDVNAWADGQRVIITAATLSQCRTDDELALVVAHEMAHNILQHRRRLGAVGGGQGLLPETAAGSAAMRQTEEEADRFAVGMMQSAGYDLQQAEPFLARLLEANDPAARGSATHPGPVRRLALLKAAVTSARLATRPAQSGSRISGKTSASARASGII